MHSYCITCICLLIYYSWFLIYCLMPKLSWGHIFYLLHHLSLSSPYNSTILIIYEPLQLYLVFKSSSYGLGWIHFFPHASVCDYDVLTIFVWEPTWPPLHAM